MSHASIIARRLASRIGTLSLLGLATCLGLALLAPTPAAAQDAAQDTPQRVPWYMPQPWMVPQSKAPKVKSLPGQYGHSKQSRTSYGMYSRNCYGDCRGVPGTIVTQSGVVLFRPVVVILDPRSFRIVKRGGFTVQQPGFVVRQGTMIQRQQSLAALPKDFVKRHPSLRNALNQVRVSGPLIVRQNGVRVMRPNIVN